MIRVFHSILVSLWVAMVSLATADPGNWTDWRGPEGTGANTQATPPTTWSETENVRWKADIPGDGQSTPIIWEDKIFLLAAHPADGSGLEVPVDPDAPDAPTRGFTPQKEYVFEVLCFSRKDGALIWKQEATRAVPPEGHLPTGSFAAYSPVTDGKYLWVSFGSRGLYCYDLEGNLQWKTPLPAMRMLRKAGEGSSPLLVGDAIVVVQDQEGQSRIAAYDKRTGAMLWEQPRDEKTTWTSPIGINVNGKAQIIVNGANKIRSYDPSAGNLIWECGGMTPNVIPTAVPGDGVVYCASGFRFFAMAAIRTDGTGDVTGTPSVLWTIDKSTPYVSTPLLYNNRLYFVENRRSALSCVDVLTGEFKYARENLDELSDVCASIAGAGGHVYVTGRNGKIAVLPQSDEFHVEAVNTLDDSFYATPVPLGQELYLRGTRHLYCIAAP